MRTVLYYLPLVSTVSVAGLFLDDWTTLGFACCAGLLHGLIVGPMEPRK